MIHSLIGDLIEEDNTKFNVNPVNLLVPSSSRIEEQHPPVLGLEIWVPPFVRVEFGRCLR